VSSETETAPDKKQKERVRRLISERVWESALQVARGVGADAVLLYAVTRVDEQSFLASRGVRSGDRVGIVSDYFVGMTRVLQLFHLPTGMRIEDLHDVDDYFYTIERGRYDQNIL